MNLPPWALFRRNTSGFPNPVEGVRTPARCDDRYGHRGEAPSSASIFDVAPYPGSPFPEIRCGLTAYWLWRSLLFQILHRGVTTRGDLLRTLVLNFIGSPKITEPSTCPHSCYAQPHPFEHSLYDTFFCSLRDEATSYDSCVDGGHKKF